MPRTSPCRRAALLPLALLLLAAATPSGPPPPNDPLVAQQHHLPIVRAFEAWEVRRGEGAIVAVLDTGVDLAHPDLQDRLVEGIDLIDPDTDPDDPQGHGTIVAGIIAAVADNGRGVAGVAPRAMVMPIRVLDERGRGTSDIVAAGIQHAIEQEVDVINLSLAEVRTETGLLDVPLVANTDVRDAIADAAEAGIVVVAAAGNDGDPATPYRRDAPVLIVGATTEDDERWERSNHDDRTLYAPGTDILSTWHEGRYAKADGTSFATPIVAAGAAMLAGAGLDSEEVMERLIDTAVDIGEGLGRVDLAAAVEGLEPAPPPTEPSPPPPPPTEPPPVVETAPPLDEPQEDPEQGEPVQEVLGPPPAPVTEAPPAIATVAPGSPGVDVALPAVTPVPVEPTPIDDHTPPPLEVGTGAAGLTRDVAIPLATALLAVDVLLAGWVLGRRRDH